MEFLITQKGRSLLAKSVTQNLQIKLSDMALGSGILTSIPTDISAMVDVEMKKRIENFKLHTDKETVFLRTVFINSDLLEGFYVREMGIFAIDTDGNEILYAYGNVLDQPCDYFKPGIGNVILKEIINISLKFENAEKVEIIVDKNEALVTMSDFLKLEECVEVIKSDYLTADNIANNTITTDAGFAADARQLNVAVPDSFAATVMEAIEQQTPNLPDNLLTTNEIINNTNVTLPGFAADARQLNREVPGSFAATVMEAIEQQNNNLPPAVAMLTVTTSNQDDLNDPVSVSNARYTITTNFDTASSITLPIYTWGEHDITSKNGYIKLNIIPDQYEYILHDFGARLFAPNDPCTAITGGWQSQYEIAGGRAWDSAPLSFSINTTLNLSSAGTSSNAFYSSAAARTINKIDFRPFRYLCIDLGNAMSNTPPPTSWDGANSPGGIGVTIDDNPTDFVYGTASQVHIGWDLVSKSNSLVRFDLPKMSVPAYLYFHMAHTREYSQRPYMSLTVKRVWLE